MGQAAAEDQWGRMSEASSAAIRRTPLKATTAAINDRLNCEINAGLADPRLKARYTELGVTLLGGPPADASLIAEHIEKWGKVIRAGNIRPE
jgi:hypothetical protein